MKYERLPQAANGDRTDLEQHDQMIACLELLAYGAVVLRDTFGDRHRTIASNLNRNVSKSPMGRTRKLATQFALIFGEHRNTEVSGATQFGPRRRTLCD
jgi:hypothetical protein